MQPLQFTSEQQVELNTLLSRFSLKKIIRRPAADGGGYICADVYFDKRRIDTFLDSDNERFSYSNPTGQACLELFKTPSVVDLAHIEYHFMPRDRVNERHIMEFVVNQLLSHIEDAKMKKKAANTLLFKVEVGPSTQYHWATFSKCKSFEDILKIHNGKELLQRTYNRMIETLKTSAGGKILTPASLLKSLGISVVESFHDIE